MKLDKRQHWLGLFIFSLGAIFYFYEYFLRIAPSVMRVEWMQEFNLDATGFGELSQYYFLAYTPMQAVVGLMIDRVNLRNLMTFAVICCSVGSFMMAVSSVYSVVAMGRFLQGFGSAFGFVGALKLAAIWLPVNRFAFYSGLCCMGGFFGAAFGMIGLNHMVAWFGWREAIEAFTVMGLFIAIAFVVFLGFEPKKQQCTSLGAQVPFVDTLKQFLAIMKHANLWLAGLISFLMFLPTSVFAALWGTTYIGVLHPDFSAQQATWTTAMIFIGWGIGSPLIGYISDVLNRRVSVILIGSLCSCGLASIALYTSSLSFPFLCVVFVLFGIASSVQVLTFSMARDLCTASIAGTAVAFVNTLAMLGGMIFQRGIGVFLDHFRAGRVDDSGLPLYLLEDYQKAFVLIPGVLGLAFFMALLAWRGELRIKRQQEAFDLAAVKC